MAADLLDDLSSGEDGLLAEQAVSLLSDIDVEDGGAADASAGVPATAVPAKGGRKPRLSAPTANCG